MKPLRALAAACTALVAAFLPPLQGAPSDLDAGFLANVGLGITAPDYGEPNPATGAVNAVALQPDGKILLGGNVSKFNNSGAIASLRRLNANGTLDATFNPGGGAGLASTAGQTEINTFTVLPDGKFYVGGTFDSYNGTARGGFARLNADGTLDANFAFGAVGGPNRYVHASAVQVDGKVLIGGGFTSVNGTTRINFARLNADGSLDTAFAPTGLTTNGSVRDLAVATDGRIYVVGSELVTARSRNEPILRRYLPNGVLDASFAPVFGDDYGAIGTVLALPDGRVLVGGDIALPGSDTIHNLACFKADGSLDTAFMANNTGLFDGNVMDLVATPDGQVLASGIFTFFNGLSRASIARLTTAGVIDATFAPAPYAGRNAGYITHFYSLAAQPDGRILAGGWFDRVSNPALEINNIVRFEGDFTTGPGKLGFTAPLYTANENAGAALITVARAGGITGAVSVSYTVTAGTATAADFTAASGTLSWVAGEGGAKTIPVTLTNDSAMEAQETVTLTLSAPTGSATLGLAAATLAIADDDSAPLITQNPLNASLEQGGAFTLSVRYTSVRPATIQWQRDPDGAGPLPFADLPGATSVNYTVAAAVPATHAGFYRAVATSSAGATNSDHATVTISVPAGTVIDTFAPPALGEQIVDTAIDSSGRFVIASNLGLRRYTAAGVADGTFTNATFATLPVSSVHVLADGRIVVGGFFTTVNGTARATLARFSADGVLDTAYAPALPTATGTLYAQTIAPGAGGKYYVGFGSGGGLRRYNADGSHDTSFAPAANTVGNGLNGAVHAVRELADGRVLVAHQANPNFSTLTPSLVLLTSTGATASGFVPPTLVGGEIRALDVLPDGRIAIGGRFSSVNGTALGRIALLHSDGTVAPSFRLPAGLAPDNQVSRILYRDGRLLVAGSFANIGGQAIRGLARLNLDGSLDPTFSVGVGADGSVNSTHYTAAGDIFLAGGFTTFKGLARNRAAILVGNAHIGAVGFLPPRVSTIEGSPSITLTLRRYGPVTEAVSIGYATTDALAGLGDTSAVAGTDYLGATGTVSWAAGDSADKAITVQLFNDDTIETTKTFRVVLQNPVGATSAAAPATIQIIDDDTPVTFTQQPTPATTTLTVGGALVLNVTASSPSPVGYQWFLNGVALPGITGPGYVKTPLTTADAGLYTVVATNASGSYTSEPSFVIVSPQAGRVAAGQATAGRPDFFPGSNPTSLVALSDGGALVAGPFGGDVAENRHQSYLLRIRPDGTDDTSFNFTLNGDVSALLRQPDGKILVGGSFTTVNGATHRILARLNADLSPDTAFNTAIATALGTANGTLTDLALDSTGRVYLGFNNFSSGSVLRVSSAGVPDNAYFVTTSTVSFGAGVTALAIQSDDKLLVGGNFTHVTPVGGASTSKNRLARLLPDGSLDTAFTAALGTMPINDLLVTPAGRIFVAGGTGGGGVSVVEVSSTDGTTLRNVASGNQTYEVAAGPDGRLVLARASSSGVGSISRLNIPADASASADPSFVIGTGPERDVTTLAYAPDGSLWIAGQFSTFDGFASNGVVRLQGSPGDPGIVNPPARADANAGATARFSVGAVGTNLSYLWSKNGSPLANGGRITGATGPVLTITGLVASDDNTYTVAVTGGTPANTVTSAPVKLNVLAAPLVALSPASVTPALGSTVVLAADILAASPAAYVWTRGDEIIRDGGRYSGATTGTLVITGANNADNGAYTLTVTNNLGSIFTAPATVTVAQVAASRDTTLAALSASNPGNANNNVYALLHLPDGRTLMGGIGSFRGVVNTPVSSQLVVIDSAGNLSATPAGGFGGEVRALHRLPDGKILVAGGFTSVDGVSGPGRNRIARLNADLTLDTSFTAVGPTAGITRLAVDTQGRIYLYGSFFTYDGQIGYSNFVRLLPDGALDLDYKVSLSGSVNALVALPDGKLLVGGGLGSHVFNDIITNVTRLCRLLPTGAIDPTFASGLPTNFTLDALAIDATGRLLVGGNSFTTQANYHLVRLLATGAADPAFTFVETIDQSINALAALPDGRFLVGGSFTTPASRFFRLNADATRDTGFNVGTGFTPTTFGPSVGVIVPDHLGRIWIGGTRFTSYNGVAANAIAVLQGDGPVLAFTAQPGGRTVDLGAPSVQFSASATGNNGFAFQWLKNGAPLANGGRISGATTGTLHLANVASSDAASYSVVVSTPSASLTSASATLTILAGPVTTRDPVALTRDVGGSATFTGAATGASTLAYQWLHGTTPLVNGTAGGVTIAGATTPTLTVSGLTFAQAGEYRLRVTNNLGAATTAPAVLTVQYRPGALAAGVNQPSFSGEVRAIQFLPDGSYLVGGQFTSVTVNGVTTSRGRLARILANGTLDTAFAPTFNNTIHAIAVDSAGRVFIGGDFTSVTLGGTFTRTRVARLTSALALDTAFDTSTAGPNSNVFALAPVGDGSVYIGGSFTAIGAVNTAAVARMARLNASGALDGSFTSEAPATAGTGVFVNSIVRLANGTLYVGGNCNTWGTAALPGNPTGRMVKLSASGNRSTFAAPDVFTIVNEIIPLADGSLLVGGNSGGQQYLKRVAASDGAILTAYDTLLAGAALSHLSQVSAIAQQADGKILSGALGTFRRTNIAGVADTGLGAFNSTIHALATDSAGRIYAGGSFSTYDGTTVGRFAILNGGEAESRDGLLTPQTLTFTDIADRPFNPAANTLPLAATASSGLTPVTFAVTSGPATISGNTLTVTGAGEITVTATQAGNATFRSATATQTFTVNKASQTITFGPLTNKSTTSAPFTVSATTNAPGLAVQFTISGPASLSGNTVTLTGAEGTVTVTAIQPGNADYAAATPVAQSFTVAAIPLTAQTITFTQALPNRLVSAAPFALSATASSGLAVQFAVSGPATLSGATLTLTGETGTVTVTASQSGGERSGASYAAATPVVRSFEVTAAPPSRTQKITFAQPAPVTYGQAPLALAGTADSGLPVAFEVVSTTPAGIAALEGSTLTISGAGKIVLKATQPGNAVFKPAAAITRTLVVNKARLGVKAVSVSRLIGAPNPAPFTLDYTDTDFVHGDTEADLAASTRPVAKTTATVKSAQGDYAITVSGGLDANYLYVPANPPGKLTVLGFGGTYEALLLDDDLTPVGKLTLTVPTNAFSYSGSLILAGEAAPASFKSDSTHLLIPASDAASASVEILVTILGTAYDLTLTVNADGTFTGSLERDAEAFGSLDHGARVTVFPKGQTAPGAGTNTLALHPAYVLFDEDQGPIPGGSGHAAASVAAPTGVITLKGKVADGLPLTASFKPTTTGYHLWTNPYGSRTGSFLAGRLALQPHPDQTRFPGRHYIPSDSGLLTWEKAPLPGTPRIPDASYRGGFGPLGVRVSLDPWLPPSAKATPAVPAGTLVQRLGLASQATVAAPFGLDYLIGDDAPVTEAQIDSLPASLSLAVNGKPVLPVSNPAKFALTFASATGAFSGSFVLSDQVNPLPAKPTLRTVAFTGTLRQSPDDDTLIGTGFFLVPGFNKTDEQPSGEIRFSVPTPAP